jgi:pyridoxal 5'-phosphate synthase pdxT subunit
VTDLKSTIGVLALQGDFDCHRQRLNQLGACVRLVRTAGDLDHIGALVIPGGESTTMLTLAGTDLLQQLHRFVREHPTLGTCAGAILLARAVVPWQPSLGAIDITIRRNAYGRQVDSSIRTGQLGTSPIELVFIRAPRIVGVGMHVDVLARENHDPVLVREGHVMAATFHPELGEDTRVLQMFLDLVAQYARQDRLREMARPRAEAVGIHHAVLG